MTRQLDTAPRRRIQPSWIAAALFVLTVAGGVAARVVTTGALAPDPPIDSLHFTAPGGGGVHFTGRLDRGSVLAGGDGLVRMELVLSAEERHGSAPPQVPTDLVVVLDRSGSMQGDALTHAKSAIHELVSGLSPEDRFALVSYASDSRLDVGLGQATPEARQRWRSTVDAIRAQGGTNMSSGLDRGVESLVSVTTTGRAPRLVLLSDGHANQGDHSPGGLLRRAARAVSSEFVLSTVGVGLGFDEDLMGRLADAGTGNFYYVDRATDLAQVFAAEFDSARETVAQSLTVEITPAAGVDVVEAAGYPLERAGHIVQFRPGSLFAGQQRRIWVTLRAADGEPGHVELGHFGVAYREVGVAGAPGARQTLAFARRPQIARVEAERDYYAAIDAVAFEEGLASEGVNQLKQSIAQKVRDGDGAGARSEIEQFRSLNRAVVEALGGSADDSVALQQADALEAEVQEAMSPSAPPEAPKRLGKKLKADGRDGRRVGAKKAMKK